MHEIRSRFALGVLSTGRHRFFAQLGWESWRGPTFVRDGDVVRRTPKEDDAVMVLRFGPTRALDLSGAITCAARSGTTGERECRGSWSLVTSDAGFRRDRPTAPCGPAPGTG